jgi:tight adherence protein C
MALLFIIGVVLLGLAAALILRAIIAPRLRVAAQVEQLGGYGYNRGAAAPGADARHRGPGLAERIGSFMAHNVTVLKPPERRELMAAGIYELTPERFHGWRVLAAVSFPGLLLLLFTAAASLRFLQILLIAVMVVLTYYLPLAVLRTRGQRRLDRVDNDLPELIDAVAATIETGLSFASSLGLVVNRLEGPLGNEMRLTLQEQQMGLPIEAALGNLVERCDTPSMRSFSKAVLQADSLGVSVGKMLRNLAVDVRQRRRGKARERAQRAPVKMLFPLIFLIFPAMLIVLLYPTAAAILRILGH